MTFSSTLPSLLRGSLAGLERSYAEEGAGMGRMPSLDMWSNLLRALDTVGTNERELPAAVRLSKRAVRLRLTSAARRGWVEPVHAVRGPASVRLTVLGSDVVARWKSLQGSAEQGWHAKIGLERAGRLRASLEEVVAMFPLEHPHFPASYGAADASITGGDGEDWKAVRRGEGDTVSSLPISALLSQALVAFAMMYEERSPVAFSLGSTVIRRIPVGGRPLRGLGSTVAISALSRHGFVWVSGNRGSEAVFLTPNGLSVHRAFDEWVDATEKEWRSKFGNESVVRLRRALEDLNEPYLESDSIVGQVEF